MKYSNCFSVDSALNAPRPPSKHYRLNIKKLLIYSFLVGSLNVYAEERLYRGDIDCDGTAETITLEVHKDEFSVSVTPSSSKIRSSLTFGLGQPSRQDAICGSSPDLKFDEAATEETHLNMLGEVIGGYKYSGSCQEIIVGGGDCDPIYIFFNHKTGALSWLRL